MRSIEKETMLSSKVSVKQCPHSLDVPRVKMRVYCKSSPAAASFV
ncbi:hypothetical protein OIU78_020281, partial [Salix suchowensis]